MNQIDELVKLIENSKKTVFFGGAGVSTESGLKDFRSKDGLYNEKYAYKPEKILSHHFFEEKKEEFYKFYKDKLNSLNYKPNKAHEVLQKLESKQLLSSVITQNIDGFHQMAGSKNVLELHGSVLRNYCVDCGKFYSAIEIFNSKDLVPKCSCGGVIKPDVVLYEESLKEDVLRKAIKEISTADLLIIGGTSLNVYPAAGLIQYFRGNKIVLINKDETPYDSICNLIIHESIGKVMQELIEKVK